MYITQPGSLNLFGDSLWNKRAETLSSTELSSSSNSLPVHSPAFTPNDMTNSNLCLAPRMPFFPASAKKSWSKADEAKELVLQAESPSFNRLSTKHMMSTLVKVVTTYFSQPTPEERPEARPKARPHEHEIKRLRRELRTLRKNWRQHRNELPESTLKLRQAFHAAHRRLKRLTSDSRTSKLNQKCQSTLRQFRADPFRFGQKLFKPKNESKPAFDADAAYNHFVNCYIMKGGTQGFPRHEVSNKQDFVRRRFAVYGIFNSSTGTVTLTMTAALFLNPSMIYHLVTIQHLPSNNARHFFLN